MQVKQIFFPDDATDILSEFDNDLFKLVGDFLKILAFTIVNGNEPEFAVALQVQ